MQWLLSLLKAPIQWLIGLILGQIFSAVERYFKAIEARKEADRIAKENLEKYKNAVEKGSEDEIAKAGETLLNGTTDNP